MEKPIAIYIRVSTDEQAENGHSLDQQREHLIQFAKANGLEQHRIYQDDGYSAKTIDRPAMQQMLQDIKQGLLCGVLTTKIDRLTRKNKDFGYLLDLFDRHGVFYKAANQNFEVSTASGKLLAQMLSVVAEFEREMIAERVYENLLRMAKNKLLVTKPPFGYQLREKELVIHEEEAGWIRQCADLLLAGQGSRQVAQFLNNHGVFTRHGKQWSAGAVRNLFRNKILIGQFTWNVRKGSGAARKQRDPSEWIVHCKNLPALLTPEEFESIQNQIKLRTALAPRARNGARLLSGVAKCGFCGGSMHSGWQIYTTKAGKQKHPTYRCGNYATSGSCPYINRVNAEDLDDAVIAQLMQLMTKPFDPSLIKNRQQQEMRRKIQEMRKLDHSLSFIEHRFQKLIDDYAIGILSAEEWVQAKARLQQEKQEKTARLAALRKHSADSEDPDEEKKKQEKIDKLMTRLEGHPEARRLAVVELVEEVKVYREQSRKPAEIEIILRY